MLTEKDYCDYDTCVALKELGYNQYTSLRSYAGKGGVRLWDFDGEPNYKEGELIALSDMYDIPSDGNEVAAPLLYEAQKWLREEKFLLIVVDRLLSGEYVFSIVDILNYSEEKNGTANSYEEALSEGIKEAIKILKEKLNEET